MNNNTLTRAEKMRQNRLKKILNNYEFEIDINNSNNFKEYLDKEINVLHKYCNKTYKVTLKDFYKGHNGSLSYLYNYVDDKVDLCCPHCLQEIKNKYFQDVLDEKTGHSYELVSDYKVSNGTVQIRHKVCGEVMQIWASSIISSKTRLKCAHCVKLLTKSERVKQNSFIEATKDYNFPFDVKEPYLFKTNLNTVVNITHKKCGKSFSVKFKEFNKLNIGQNMHLKNHIESELDIKCPHCIQEAKNKYFQSILYELSKGDFTLIGNYSTTREYVEVAHTLCGEKFKINAGEVVIKRKISCKICTNNEGYQKKIQEEKNRKFNNYLKEKGLSDFEIVGDYIDRKTKVRLRHNSCGHEFTDIIDNFLRRRHKCQNCADGNRFTFGNQEDRNVAFNKRLNKLVEGFELVGNYYGIHDKLTLYHKDCKKEFTTTFDSFLDSKNKCPHCQSNKYKYNKYITIKEKIKCFERDLENKYKILSGFTTVSDKVTMKHKQCGKTFTIVLNNALRYKEKDMVCPRCELERRKNKFLEKLNNKWGNAYTLVGEYINGTTKTLFKHRGCKVNFEITPNKLLDKKVEDCPSCKNKNIYRAGKFKSRLYEKHGTRYLMVGEYVSYDKKILFRDKICGHPFTETPQNMLSKEIPCKRCSLKKRMIPFEEVMERIKKYNGNKFTLAGEYRGTEKILPVICNDCNHVFELEPARLFRSKLCPNCKSKKE